jgi:hypothetical protein
MSEPKRASRSGCPVRTARPELDRRRIRPPESVMRAIPTRLQLPAMCTLRAGHRWHPSDPPGVAASLGTGHSDGQTRPRLSAWPTWSLAPRASHRRGLSRRTQGSGGGARADLTRPHAVADASAQQHWLSLKVATRFESRWRCSIKRCQVGGPVLLAQLDYPSGRSTTTSPPPGWGPGARSGPATRRPASASPSPTRTASRCLPRRPAGQGYVDPDEAVIRARERKVTHQAEQWVLSGRPEYGGVDDA